MKQVCGQKNCRQQAVASHANASWYRIVVTCLLQDVHKLGATCVFLVVWVGQPPRRW